MVGAFRDVVPGANLRLELREGRVHPPGHGRLLGFLPDDLGRQLLELAQHRHRNLEHLDLALELRPETLQRDRVLRVVVREAVDLHGRGGMIERPPQVDRERLVRVLVEAASKQANGGMIWPPGKTSIWNRPPVISSTTLASRCAAPWFTSSAGVQAVDMRHLTLGCAMTLGASMMVDVAAAATTPPAVARNLRRSVIALPSPLGLRKTIVSCGQSL
jgi:hypothetical protein